MIRWLLCRLGFHRWAYDTYQMPCPYDDAEAPWWDGFRCVCCGREKAVSP